MELSYCGLECESCPIHLATIEEDIALRNEMRAAIAQQINDHYGVNMKADDINDCDGCRSGSHLLFRGCYKCRIRKCAVEKGLKNCAHCDDYACEILLDFLQKEPDAKNRLDQVRNRIKNNN